MANRPTTASLHTVTLHTLSHSAGAVHTAVYNSNGSYVLTGGQDRQIRLWNSSTGKAVKEYSGHGHEVLGVAVTPDNSRLGSCGGDRNVLLWDVTSGQVIKRFGGHISTVNTVAFSFDGNVLASGGFDSSVRLWDCKSQQRTPIQVLEEAKDSVSCIVIRASEILTGSVDGHVRSYDLRKGQIRADYFEKPVTSVHLLSDAQTYLVSTLDSAIRLMDRENGELLQTFSGHRNKDYKSRVCCGFGEATALAGDEDGMIWCWDLETGKSLATVKGHDKLATWVEYHPKGVQQMVTAGSDGKAKLWGPLPA